MDSENDIVIVYHSQSGNTERLSAAVEQGALRVRGVRVRRARAAQVTCQDLRD
jgi:flavorubredoxin